MAFESRKWGETNFENREIVLNEMLLFLPFVLKLILATFYINITRIFVLQCKKNMETLLESCDKYNTKCIQFPLKTVHNFHILTRWIHLEQSYVTPSRNPFSRKQTIHWCHISILSPFPEQFQRTATNCNKSREKLTKLEHTHTANISIVFERLQSSPLRPFCVAW